MTYRAFYALCILENENFTTFRISSFEMSRFMVKAMWLFARPMACRLLDRWMEDAEIIHWHIDTHIHELLRRYLLM